MDESHFISSSDKIKAYNIQDLYESKEELQKAIFK